MRNTMKVTCLSALGSVSLLAASPAYAWNWQEHRNAAVFTIEAMKRTPSACKSGSDNSEDCQFTNAMLNAPVNLSKLRTDVMQEGYPLSSKPEDLGGPSDFEISSTSSPPFFGKFSYRSSGSCNYPENLKLSQIGKLSIETLKANKLEPERKPTPGCGFATIPINTDLFYPNVSDSLGYVLGWHAGHVDNIVGDGSVFIKMTNTQAVEYVEMYYEYMLASAAAAAAPIVAILCSVYCIASWILGDSCDPGDLVELVKDAKDFLDEGVDYIDPSNWLMPSFEINAARALWQFNHMDRVGQGTYNNIPGMDYRHAGRSVPVLPDNGALDVAIEIASEFAGLTVDPITNTGVSTYAKFDEKQRSFADWRREPFSETEFSGLDKLAAWGWDQYLKNPGHSAPLGWPLHALGDASNPQHVTGTTGNGHRPVEDAMKDPAVWLKMADLKKPQNVLDVQTYARKWWNFMNKCQAVDVASLVRTVAAENRAMFGDWAYSDYQSSFYALPLMNSIPPIDTETIATEYFSKDPNFAIQMRPAVQNSLGAMAALLACAGNVPVPPYDESVAFCSSGTYYDYVADACTTTTPDVVPGYGEIALASPNYTPAGGEVGDACSSNDQCTGDNVKCGSNNLCCIGDIAGASTSKPCTAQDQCCPDLICWKEACRKESKIGDSCSNDFECSVGVNLQCGANSQCCIGAYSSTDSKHEPCASDADCCPGQGLFCLAQMCVGMI